MGIHHGSAILESRFLDTEKKLNMHSALSRPVRYMDFLL